MTDTNADLNAILVEYAAAVLAKAPGRLADLYAPDVRVFDAWEVWSFEGREAWSRNLHDWLGSLGEERVQVGFDEVRVHRSADAASITAIVTHSAIDASGKVIRSMQERLSWFLVKTDGRWLIAHAHTSPPIGFKDQKAILRRE